MSTQYTAQKFSLGQDITAGTTYLTVDFTFTTAPLFTEGKIKMNRGEQSEWWVIEDLSLVAGETTLYRADVLARGLDKDAATIADTSTANQKDHNVTTECKFVTHSLDWNGKASTSGNNTFSGDYEITGSLVFTGTTEAGMRLQNVTTAQRDALTGTDVGTALYNTDTDTAQVEDNSGTFQSLPTGSTNPNATEILEGRVELSTVAEQIAATNADSLVVQPRYLIANASATKTADAGRITKTDATGKLNYQFIPGKSGRFGGTGADGAFTGTGVQIASGYTVKNYTSFAPSGNLSVPAGSESIWHIKVKGDADLNGITIDLQGSGGGGGAGGMNEGSGNVPGVDGGGGGYRELYRGVFPAENGGEGGSTAQTIGGTPATPMAVLFDLIPSSRMFLVSCGGGGGGGGSGGIFSGNAVPPDTCIGGDGGEGGGGLILEIAGDADFTGCTIDVSGNNGTIGANSNAAYEFNAGGGGGGGGAGTVLILVNGTITGTPTITITGGTGGAGGTGTPGDVLGYRPGAGGAGGSNIATSGVAGTNGVDAASGNGGAGGNGAAGDSLIYQNEIFT